MLTRKKHLERKTGLKPSTKRMKQGRSTGKPTKAESARIVQSKEGPCCACHVRVVNGDMHADNLVIGCDYNHAKSGNIRRGHAFGYALCPWHHRRVPNDLRSIATHLEVYGPSLMDGSRLFHATYGSDDTLIELQTQLNEESEP